MRSLSCALGRVHRGAECSLLHGTVDEPVRGGDLLCFAMEAPGLFISLGAVDCLTAWPISPD